MLLTTRAFDTQDGNACVRSMRSIHQSFLRAYGLTAQQVPLVRYNIGHGFVAA